MIISFYDLLDTYADIHGIDKHEVLHLWYRGAIDAKDLLDAELQNEGTFGYTEHLTAVIKTLIFQSERDLKEQPFKLDA